ncbi:hypothetical protein [Rhodopseudomonas pseudopalustris]|uniref:Portal protein n=1 Tax=Rhodopseudomonas pseudopalustris TaxID=1513892 RepID=A0A1H8WIC3_9BRAD|nr:hypothetical protein [Rhodopseudomonas pseudopalustris]SEP27415.1 hypothetical protein SAMN05444123_112122 [Rhodopseudomonas pseudopalustris]
MSLLDGDAVAPINLTNNVPDDNEPEADARGEEKTPAESERALVNKIIRKIKSDKLKHAPAFKRMRHAMFVAMWGRDENWSEDNYKANIAGRHVKQKTATLYAKNPKATARRAERLEFALWDETPDTLAQAVQVMQQSAIAEQMHAQAQQQLVAAAVQDPLGAAVMMGHNGGPPLEPYQPPPEAMAASALLEDFQQGLERRKQLDKIGKTLEILYAKALKEQKPVDFKTGAKQLVRRTCTTGVGYVELGFQREYGPRPGIVERLADARARLGHLRTLAERAAEGEIESADAEMAELEASVAALQSEPEIVMREGLIFDYPRSTKVIPDQLCKTLTGFIGARHLTLEYDYTVDEVRELFDVDLKKFAPYTADGKAYREAVGVVFDEDGGDMTPGPSDGLVRVWKHYDKPSGLVYFVADGHDAFLREPAAPDVYVEDFWPVFALTFNAVESEDELFPPSDVHLLSDMQNEHNRSRQGKREHREARRPRWVFPNGVFEEEDVKKISKMKPYDAIGLNMDPGTDISKVLQAMPVPGVDPNLYDTGESFGDAQLVVGAQEAQLGGVSSSSATEAAIAAGSTSTADSSSVDDLDGFMSTLARAAGQILLREMSEEQVKQIVGPGAVWPQMSLADIAGEIYLEIEAGSMGKPNQAIEIKNWREILPLLIQMGSIKPYWLAKETLRRLDDRMDLTEALVEGMPSIAALNQNAQPSAAGAVNDPSAQGAAGASNAPKGPSEVQPGSEAPMGNNRV